ncbi:MAG TPA: universal stress protein [Syntrophorhabdaceae bacterium]|nr:universal stress protein [Syntrophorhabdaceae bacterium]
MLKPTKILVPTDFSEYSDKALQQGIDIARQYRAQVYLVHVTPGDFHRVVVDYAIPEEMIESIEAKQQAIATESLKTQLAKFEKAREVEVFPRIRKGIAHEELLREEKEKGIDLIVIASLGRTGLAKYLIGSVARNVLKNAVCPVLLTK